jgi:hypothetical protein
MRIPSREIPQADTLADVIRVASGVAGGASTFQAIAAHIGKVERQGRYYRLAAEILGLVQNHDNRAVLTARGRQLVRAQQGEAQRMIRQAVLGTRLIQRVLPFLETRGQVTRDEIEAFIEQVTEPTGETMIPRRASTVISWLMDVGILQPVGNHYRLSPPSAEDTTAEPPQYPDNEPIAPNATDLNEYRTVEDRASRAAGLIAYWRDQAAMDRANAEHKRLTDLTAAQLRGAGLLPRCNGMIDLAAKSGEQAYIFEIKSVTRANERHQVRTGLSQLYEYQYLQNLQGAALVLVLSEKLTDSSAWMRHYLESERNVFLVWDGNNRLYASEVTRRSLSFLWP